jgi:hypothetical protein
MKKLLLLIICFGSGAAMAQITSIFSPTVGCPNTTHDVTVSVTNNSTAVPSASTTFSVSLTVKDDMGATLKSYTSTTYSTGWAVGETKDFIILAVPFSGAMTCTIDGTISGTTIMMMMGPPPTFLPMPFPMPFTYTVPAQNYTVQSPPDLTITNTSNDLSVTTSLSGYSVQYFLDGNYGAVVDQSLTGAYTATASGSYTAMGYDPISTCLSQNASNAIVLSVTSLKEATNINISVYPNPVASTVTIDTESSVALTYELSDLDGKVVRTAGFQGTGNINMENLKSGSYILNVKNGEVSVASYKLLR